MHGSRSRGILAVASAAALAIALLPTASMASEHDGPTQRGIDRVCPAPEDEVVADPAEPDDIDGTTHEASIDCALEYGLVSGFADGSYGPNQAVTRGQMSTFVANWVRAATGAEFEPVEGQFFTDVEGTTHEENINVLAGTQVVSGREDDTFGPNEPITRGQMARFVIGAIDLADSGEVDDSLPPMTEESFFEDVDGTTFAAEINAIASVGIVGGVGDGNYAPNAAVTRGQLATFLMSAADYLDRQQQWLPTATVVTYTVPLSWQNEVDDSGDTPAFGAGDEPATGQAVVEVDGFNGTLTVDLEYGEVTAPFDGGPGAHIHAGAIDENGGVVVPLASGAELQAGDGAFSATIEEDTDTFRFADIIEDPDAFYVNVHSDAFPAGAIRGQLPTGGQGLLTADEFTVTLTGAAEVDDSGPAPTLGAGELGASADASVVVDYVAGEITWAVAYTGVTGPFDEGPGFHIHAGGANENGPIVAFLATGADLEAADGTLEGVFTDASAATLRAIMQEPGDYYLNLHSNDFPAGAVRAQLE